MTCGVYKIGFSGTNKVYIGSSKNIERRFKQHQAMLSADCHHSYKLQEYFNSTKEPINLVVLQECSEDKRTIIEAKYIDKYNSISNGFNVAEVQHFHSSEANMLKKIIEMPKYLTVCTRMLDEGFSHVNVIIASYMSNNYETCNQYGVRYFETLESIAENTNSSVSSVKSTIEKLEERGIVKTTKGFVMFNTNRYDFDTNYFMRDIVDSMV